MRAFGTQTQAIEVSRHPRLRARANGAPPQNSDRGVDRHFTDAAIIAFVAHLLAAEITL